MEVLAVNISPNTALPDIVTVPDKVALSVVMDVAVLAGDAKRVVVSALRAIKE